MIFFAVCLVGAIFILSKYLFLNTSLKSSKSQSKIIFPTPTFPVPIQIKPTIIGNSIQTPTILRLESELSTNISKSFKYTVYLSPEWEIKDYGFPLYSTAKGIYSYFLEIKNKNRPEYILSLSIKETEYNMCDFDNSIPEDLVFQLDIPTYQTISTNFGPLRIGKTTRGHYEVCQEYIHNESPYKWIGFTKVGSIWIKTSRNQEIDEDLVNQMIEMIRMIKYEEN